MKNLGADGVVSIKGMAKGVNVMSNEVLSRCINILSAPSQTMEQIAQSGKAWFPVLLKALIIGVFWFWFYQALDFGWFLDQDPFQTEGSVTAEEAAFLEKLLNPIALAAMATAAGIGLMGLIYVSLAAYLTLVNRLGATDTHGFGKWFSLVAWTAIPTILSFVTMAVLFVSNGDGQVLPDRLDVANFQNLGMNFSADSGWKSLFTSFNLYSIWSIALLALGFRQWTKSSWGRAFGIVLAPYLLVYSAWAAIIVVFW